jgi:hypothetical protein
MRVPIGLILGAALPRRRAAATAPTLFGTAAIAGEAAS